MKRRRPEVADVFREHRAEFLERYGGSLSNEQKQTLKAISSCRTAALGGHKWRCNSCGHEEISYNSCRNRHCPKCQSSARAKWLAREATYLLDVEYFHVVFTLPKKLGPLALRNKRKLYDALLRAAAHTLSTIARDPKHLGAEIGFLMVLHTWGQRLDHHPHAHCVVPGGGLSADGKRWISCRKGFFLPVRVLSRVFRRKFLDLLEQLYQSGELFLAGSFEALRDRPAWNVFVKSLRQSEWVVYSKPPFGGAEQVLKYLARYTHRVAISNQRLVSIEAQKVCFRWKDYRHQSKRRLMTLEPSEFIRRFLMHVLPRGFVRIRHYGFLSNRSRTEKLRLAKGLLASSSAAAAPPQEDPPELGETEEDGDVSQRPCPRCKQGRLLFAEEIPPRTNRLREFDDTS